MIALLLEITLYNIELQACESDWVQNSLAAVCYPIVVEICSLMNTKECGYV